MSALRVFGEHRLAWVSVMVMASVWGCNSEPVQLDPAAIYEPKAPDFLDFQKKIGIFDELDRVGQFIPQYLDTVPGLDGEGPFEVETLRNIPFRTTPQRVLTVDVHRPISADTKLRRSVLVFMGGGFVTDHDFETVGVWARFLASRGFVAFNTRQRLLIEPDMTRRDVLTDAIAAARFVATDGPRFGADPERIAALGRSTGAQLALLLGMAPSPDAFGDAGDPAVPVKIKAIVDIFGPVDDRLFFGSTEISFLPLESLAGSYRGLPEQMPDAYAEWAPMTYVRAGLPPTMIVHGLLDTTIPISHSIRFADALEAAGNDVRREFYPDMGHVIGWGLFHNDGFGRAMPRIVRFLEEVL